MRKSTLLVLTLFAGLLAGLLPAAAAAGGSPTIWGEKSSYAVVNPVVRSPLCDFISLDGSWQFSNRDAWLYRLGVGDTAWDGLGFKYDWSDSRTIQVPGNWESQGVGEPGPCKSWDCEWDRDFWDIRNVYMGFALYRKAVKIPADWSGKAVWLKIGGVRSEAYIWVNQKRAAYVNNYCATEKFNITELLVPGEEAVIEALVRNDTPSRKGCLAAGHCFGGFYRSIELEATPKVFIDDVWARGEIDGPVAQTRVTVASADGEKADFIGTLSVEIRDYKTGQAAASGQCAVDGTGEYVIDLPLKNGKLWSPESPNLYVAATVLKDKAGHSIHGWDQRFGIRKLEVRGDQFFLNGKPYFLRGMGDHHYDPFTITEGADREQYRAHMKIYKAAGFNYARHHTHAPLAEYFESADEAGILLQPELPYYHDMTTQAFSFDPMRDIQELHRTCRRYPSFGVYSCGNEGWFGHPTDEILYQWVKSHDPDRLMIHQDGGRNLPGNSDFSTGGVESPDFCVGLTRPWPRGKYDFLDRPYVAHEYLNLAIKMDSRLEDRFTGARLSPVHYDMWLEDLAACGLDEAWGAKTLKAAAKLQAHYQKAGLESARCDFTCDGYIFWSITDASIPVPGCRNTTAAQGYLNCFWEPRRDGWQPRQFYQFNGPSALLADFGRDRPIFVSGETVPVTVSLSHYDADDLAAGRVLWKVIADDQTPLASGSIPFDGAPAGFAGDLGAAQIEVPALEKPAAARFEVEIEGTGIHNDWECWLFPNREKPSLAGLSVSEELYDWFDERYTDVTRYDPAGKETLIARPEDPAVAEAISQGRNVLAISAADPTPDVQLGWWALGTQVGTAIEKTPLLGDFPTQEWMNGLWFGLIRRGAPDLREETVFGRMTPVIVGEGRDSYYLYLGQTQEGESRVTAVFAIDLEQDTPEALALLDALVKSYQTAE